MLIYSILIWIQLIQWYIESDFTIYYPFYYLIMIYDKNKLTLIWRIKIIIFIFDSIVIKISIRIIEFQSDVSMLCNHTNHMALILKKCH
jgi:hypothetical protein